MTDTRPIGKSKIPNFSKLASKISLKAIDRNRKSYYGTFKCKICCKTIYRTNFVHHLRRHIKYFKEYCNKCKLGFDTHLNYKNHLRMHLIENETIIPLENVSVISEIQYNDDDCATRKRRNVMCRMCNIPFETYYKLGKHNQIFHPPEVEQVENMIDTQGDYDYVKMSQSRDAKLQNVFNMEGHGNVPLTDQIIQKQGYTMEQLYLSHTIVDNIWKCKICCKTLGNRESFRAHLRLHTGEFVDHCKLCGRGFTRAWHLKSHKKICGINSGRRVSIFCFIN